MRGTVFQKLPQQYLILGVLCLLLGAWLEHWMRTGGASSATFNFFGATHGTLMVFFGIIPIFFVSIGYCVVPSTGVPAWPAVLDKLALVLFYVSAVASVVALEGRSMALFIFAMSLNLAFGIASAVGFIARYLHVREHGGKWRMQATAVAFVVLSSWIVMSYVLLEFAALRQLSSMWIVGNSTLTYEAPPNDVTVPLIWKHLFWFLGHPEVIVFFALFGGLVADGLRNLFARRVVA